MILFVNGNQGVLFLSGGFVPVTLPRIARNGIMSKSFILTFTGRTWG
jgi:hypothetical protein